MLGSDSRSRLLRDLIELRDLQSEVAQAKEQLRAAAGRYVYSRLGDDPLTIPTAEEEEAEELLLALRQNPAFQQSLGQSQRSEQQARPSPFASRFAPFVAGIALLLGMLLIFTGASSGEAAAGAKVAGPTVVANQPLPTVGPAHEGRFAPDLLRVKSGQFSKDLTIQSFAEDQGSSVLFSGRGDKGAGLIHYGAYPGEAGNLVLAGSQTALGEVADRLTLNDTFDVVDKNKTTYVYQLVPCDPDSGRKACQASGDAEWVVGRTPFERLPYRDPKGKSGLVDKNQELTLLVSLDPAPDQGGIGPAPTPDPEAFRNLVIRAKLVGTR